MIEIPKNDWKPASLREDKVNEAVASIVNSDGGTMYTWLGRSISQPSLENLSTYEIRYICQRFIDAGWHVYVPELRQNGSVPVTISKLPEEEFNLNKVVRQEEVTDPNNIAF